jgi:hypothetical protein
MTPHQTARRARKSAAFFAKRAEAARAAGDRGEARRLAEVAEKKVVAYHVAKGAAPVPSVGHPHFHSRLMGALDAAQYAGATLSPAHSAIRRAVREANMAGRQFQSPAELVAAVGKFSPWLATEAEKVAQAA